MLLKLLIPRFWWGEVENRTATDCNEKIQLHINDHGMMILHFVDYKLL